MDRIDSFGARSTLDVGDRSFDVWRLAALEKQGFDIAGLPYALKVLLENLLRNENGADVSTDDIRALAGWDPAAAPDTEIRFTPSRVVLQDFTGVPSVVDLAAMREAMRALGGDPGLVDPLAPVELVIDHSVIVDSFGSSQSFGRNVAIEYERNRERYQFLRWGQQAFDDFRVVPPGTGIVHQVNLEHLARVVFTRTADGRTIACPDTCVGTDSHTPMVNGLGVLGWGVGGIEAQAAMLGEPVSMLIPQVVGFKLSGRLPEGATATDLVLTITEMLRRHRVVGKFVEFYGPGVAAVPLANRATIGNMSPEYGSTVSIFPIDAQTLRYLELTGRPKEQIELVERYARTQGLWHDPQAQPRYSERLELDLASIVPSIAGPKRPQDRIALSEAKKALHGALAEYAGAPAAPGSERGYDEAVAETFPASDAPAYVVEKESDANVRFATAGGGVHSAAPRDYAAKADGRPARVHRRVPVRLAGGSSFELDHGAIVIAAITSCTNTSNPSVMMAAALLAKKAVERGLERRPWVKTSLAPGSKVVIDYYRRAGVMPYLERLGFHLVGYGCTTCIGNSGPLIDEVGQAVNENDLAVAAVLSGNRNFEGRIHPQVRLNYLASPPLVVAYALAGTMDVDLLHEPLGRGTDGSDVFLRDVWPSTAEVQAAIDASIDSSMFRERYADVFHGDEHWQALQTPDGSLFAWDPESTYVRRPPYFDAMERAVPPVTDIRGARVLALLGDSVTTDHISPAGSIARDSPAAEYLVAHGVAPADFNSYGSRRGNHEVMIRGTFANIRLRNRLAPGTEGGYTRDFAREGAPVCTIFEAARSYSAAATPLIVLAGKEYGSGSSRDWAAKGTMLLGVRAVIAESFERIHRSNLLGMGVLPLQFPSGTSVDSLGLTGEESFDITGIVPLNDGLTPAIANVRAGDIEFDALVRIDTPAEADYYRNGGIMQYVLRRLLSGPAR